MIYGQPSLKLAPAQPDGGQAGALALRFHRRLFARDVLGNGVLIWIAMLDGT